MLKHTSWVHSSQPRACIWSLYLQGASVQRYPSSLRPLENRVSSRAILATRFSAGVSIIRSAAANAAGFGSDVGEQESGTGDFIANQGPDCGASPWAWATARRIAANGPRQGSGLGSWKPTRARGLRHHGFIFFNFDFLMFNSKKDLYILFLKCFNIKNCSITKKTKIQHL